MKISTAGRYALRSMLDLALHEQEGPVLRQEIAERQGLSADYIAQIFRELARAGLVKSVMGPGGGYQLAKQASAISVGAVLRAVEGPLSAVYCVDPQNQQVCPRQESCATHLVWLRLSQLIDQFLDSITLETLCQEARNLAQANPNGVMPIEQMFHQIQGFEPPESRAVCNEAQIPLNME